jgi:hypothetical protein
MGPLALGNRVHAAIEYFYRGEGSAVTEHERLSKIDLAKLEADPDVKPWEMDTFYSDVIMGRNCVRLHEEWLAATGADDNYSIEGVEHLIEAPLLDGAVTIRGKADVLFRRRDNGFIVVDDLKTDGGWGGGVREQLERSWQHHVYLIALRLSGAFAGEVIEGAEYTVIRKVKNPARSSTPLVQRYRVPATTRVADNKLKQLEVIVAQMLKAMDQIEDEGVAYAYPVPSQQCQWCDFKQPCELMDESAAAARSMLDANYIRGGRHGRYDGVTL